MSPLAILALYYGDADQPEQRRNEPPAGEEIGYFRCKTWYIKSEFRRCSHVDAEHSRKPLCAVDYCGGHLYGQGYCSKHFRNWRLSGDPLREAPYKPCPICGKPIAARGLCDTHYRQWLSSHRAMEKRNA